MNRPHYETDVLLYIGIIEAEKLKPHGLKYLLPGPVSQRLVTLEMVATIYLNDQVEPLAIKVYDVTPQWLLAIELIAPHLPGPELLPKQNLTQRAVIAQVTRELFQVFIVR